MKLVSTTIGALALGLAGSAALAQGMMPQRPLSPPITAPQNSPAVPQPATGNPQQLGLPVQPCDNKQTNVASEQNSQIDSAVAGAAAGGQQGYYGGQQNGYYGGQQPSGTYGNQQSNGPYVGQQSQSNVACQPH